MAAVVVPSTVDSGKIDEMVVTLVWSIPVNVVRVVPGSWNVLAEDWLMFTVVADNSDTTTWLLPLPVDNTACGVSTTEVVEVVSARMEVLVADVTPLVNPSVDIVPGMTDGDVVVTLSVDIVAETTAEGLAVNSAVDILSGPSTEGVGVIPDVDIISEMTSGDVVITPAVDIFDEVTGSMMAVPTLTVEVVTGVTSGGAVISPTEDVISEVSGREVAVVTPDVDIVT